MKSKPRISSGTKDIVSEWDGRDFVSRLYLIMNNLELFWAMELITRSEIEMLLGMPEADREYIVGREDHPFLTSIDLKKTLAAQIHRDKLEAALRAVFKFPAL
ncbi:MAG: hypothetical protein V1880_01615 [Patescibacteria group bacterium]